MPGMEHAERLWSNLTELGPRRLAALGIIGAAILLAIGLGAYFVARPQMDTLYTGLERDDVARIGSTLTDAGIPFDVNAKGDAVLVPPSQLVRARMILAERGLPQSANAGYELFDHLGSLGLTSFMQEVTRVRALEGEIARTIQSMKGIRAARVHLVLGEPGSFRQEKQPPSASVVIRVETADGVSEAQAIRHLVASAVPGMTIDHVTVLSSDGTLLVAGEGPQNGAAGQSVTLERTVAKEVEDNIRRTLTPYLGLDNFQISVAAKLNTDRKQIKETIYNPDTKVERSVRSVRENQNNQNSSRQKPTTVEQNVPDQQVNATGGNQSAEESQRREDLTNYELSSKTVQTTSDGYDIENLSVAVLVNRSQLVASLGKEASSDAIAARIKEIRDIAMAAAGAKTARGDLVQVTMVDFSASASAMAPEPGLNLGQFLIRQSGTLINAATVLLVAGMLVWFGLRPAVNTILEHRKQSAEELAAQTQLLEAQQATGMSAEQLAYDAGQKLGGDLENDRLLEDLTNKLAHSPIKRLEQMVQLNEEQAVNILKQWMHTEEA